MTNPEHPYRGSDLSPAQTRGAIDLGLSGNPSEAQLGTRDNSHLAGTTDYHAVKTERDDARKVVKGTQQSFPDVVLPRGNRVLSPSEEIPRRNGITREYSDQVIDLYEKNARTEESDHDVSHALRDNDAIVGFVIGLHQDQLNETSERRGVKKKSQEHQRLQKVSKLAHTAANITLGAGAGIVTTQTGAPFWIGAGVTAGAGALGYITKSAPMTREDYLRNVANEEDIVNKDAAIQPAIPLKKRAFNVGHNELKIEEKVLDDLETLGFADGKETDFDEVRTAMESYLSEDPAKRGKYRKGLDEEKHRLVEGFSELLKEPQNETEAMRLRLALLLLDAEVHFNNTKQIDKYKKHKRRLAMGVAAVTAAVVLVVGAGKHEDDVRKDERDNAPVPSTPLAPNGDELNNPENGNTADQDELDDFFNEDYIDD